MRLIHALARLAAALVVLSGATPAAATPGGHCAEWARRLPSLSRALCEQAALVAPGATSVKGVPLYVRDVRSPVAEPVLLLPTQPTKPARPPRRVLVIGGIHGDELSSTSLVFHWIAQANQAAAGMDWRFLPALNPDGLLLARPSRVNANGVDLNRNFPHAPLGPGGAALLGASNQERPAPLAGPHRLVGAREPLRRRNRGHVEARPHRGSARPLWRA